jgi:hypothetical protein
LLSDETRYPKVGDHDLAFVVHPADLDRLGQV